jgi:hypothetical protein
VALQRPPLACRPSPSQGRRGAGRARLTLLLALERVASLQSPPLPAGISPTRGENGQRRPLAPLGKRKAGSKLKAGYKRKSGFKRKTGSTLATGLLPPCGGDGRQARGGFKHERPPLALSPLVGEMPAGRGGLDARHPTQDPLSPCHVRAPIPNTRIMAERAPPALSPLVGEMPAGRGGLAVRESLAARPEQRRCR